MSDAAFAGARALPRPSIAPAVPIVSREECAPAFGRSPSPIAEILDRRRADHLRFGTADLSGLLPPEFSPTPYAVSILRRLDDAVIDGIAGGPTFAYHGEYRRANEELAEVAEGIASDLEASGHAALAVPPTQPHAAMDAEYLRSLRSPVSHKMAGTRSGLGWIGKTDLFVSFAFGPRLRMATVLTDLPLAPASPPVGASLCGSCSRCVDLCPGRAATGIPWVAGMEREDFFDAFRCRQTCRMQARENLGLDASICGICMAVCPRGRRGA